jgi:hypothetical protein
LQETGRLANCHSRHSGDHLKDVISTLIFAVPVALTGV